jgi:ferric-dicitrate binding protein FerR (iron transport regulator)
VLALLVVCGVYLLRIPALRPAMVYQQKRTSSNQTVRMTLADGSVVHLNSNSSLSYPRAFRGEIREVYLRGEAYFEIAKDPAHPFLIHSGRLQTRVVGTSFNVYAYPQAPRLEVTVLTGRVLVSDSASGKTVALHPAQKVVLVPTDAGLHLEPAPNPQLSLAWQQGKLRFEQATLAEITDKLALRYGVHITLGSAQLRHCRLTVEFGRESLATALEVLTALTGSTYTQHQQQITLTGAGC